MSPDLFHDSARCKGCNDPVVWIETENGKRMPCDPKRVTIVTDDGRTVTGRVPHWSTCARAGQFRKGGDPSA